MAAGDQTNLKFAKDSGSSYTFTKCDQLPYPGAVPPFVLERGV